ncbi:hypothetical protein RND71_042624 [Anisodus tanguticus]|uniref:Uncharacterized protein n=1 Tax=Anisodus tanguticus TaxID=243964 RepID=A0AAE1UPB0_9SOLA|nr:hypothetical protein RND71_042624 [Anisodus tanguticus]
MKQEKGRNKGELEMKQREDHLRAEINVECQKKMDAFMDDLQNKLETKCRPF